MIVKPATLFGKLKLRPFFIVAKTKLRSDCKQPLVNDEVLHGVETESNFRTSEHT